MTDIGLAHSLSAPPAVSSEDCLASPSAAAAAAFHGRHPSLSHATDRLLRHGIYRAVDTIPKLRLFMEDHVFAVWDFMSLAKRLQRDLTCVSLPWIPSADASLARFINDIVHSEESDLGPNGVAASHLEIYLEAMEEIGADRRPFFAFLAALRADHSPAEAIASANVPRHVQAFVLRTLQVALNATTVEVAADFLYGREDVIPEMFMRLLSDRDEVELPAPLFRFYLDRHVELDGNDHGPAAWRMLDRLVDGRDEQWDCAATAAQRAIDSRIALWDGCISRLNDSYRSRTEAVERRPAA